MCEEETKKELSPNIKIAIGVGAAVVGVTAVAAISNYAGWQRGITSTIRWMNEELAKHDGARLITVTFKHGKAFLNQ